MPSDLPPQEAPKPGAAGSPGPEASDGRPETASAEGRSTDRTVQSGFSAADLRRYAAQTHADGGGKPQQSSISNSFALAMIVAFIVIAVVMLREGPALVTPARVLPGGGVTVPNTPPADVASTGTGAAAGAAATAPSRRSINPDSPVARAFGVSTLEQVSRRMQRVGEASAIAAECGVTSYAWVNDVRDVLARDISERYPAFEDTARTKLLLKQFAASSYKHGQNAARDIVAKQGKETACGNIRYSPDYRTAVNAAQQAGLR